MNYRNEAINKIMDAAGTYHTIKKASVSMKEENYRKYIGETLIAENEAVDGGVRAAETALRMTVQESRQEALQKAIASAKAAAEAGKAASVDGANIPDDIKLLSLPVVLTGEELQTILDKNINNPVFARAVEDYTKKHSIPVALDYRTPHEKAISRIHGVFDYMENNSRGEGTFQVMLDNPRIMEKVDNDLAEAMAAIE